ncbi:unnamed protein product [Kluyveromyces dobzhanskii CBS 2104]|uniref:WGS project CCBQ000000000 data, contig MAT n=1 Tax=Kluyveromyces dobzhanskii CBS 2104 TaxID=1427455 RepID=A0A0A8L1F4_9SACH|nr:unnamed protein product [Kluyveromyces dobzhanskii CBS 2104]
MAGQDTDQLLKDKKGRSRACLLCQRRKQKCDHKIPSCTACLKAGVKCVQPAKYGYDVAAGDHPPQPGAAKGQDDAAPLRRDGAVSETTKRNTAHGTLKQGSVGADNAAAGGNGSVSANTNRGEILNNSNNINNENGDPYSHDDLNSINIKNNDLYNADHSRLSELASAAGSASPSPSMSSTAMMDPRKVKSKRSHKDGKDEYTLFLEKKLKYLEKLVDMKPDTNSYKERLGKYKKVAHLLDNGEANQDDITSILPPNVATHTTSVPSASAISSQQRNGLNQEQQVVRIGSPILPLPSKAKFLSLHQQSQNQPQRSGMIKTPHSHERALESLASDSLESIDYSRCIFAKYNLKEFLSYDPAFEFDEQLSRSFLDTYFTRLQFKYPLLDEQEVYTFHNDYINNNVHSYSINEFHFSCGRMWLVFSISAHLHKTTGKYQGLPPNRYFSTAIRHITKCGTNLTLVQQVEVLTLLILYIIRTDRDSIGLYEIIKDVMNICKNKLHLNKWNPKDSFANKKLRLFWCVYLIERMICVAVGKPYTIYESEIDLPFFNKDSFYTRETDMAKHEHGVHFINQSLKLRRIESTFVEELNIISQKPGAVTSNIANQKKLTAAEISKIQAQLPQVKKFFQDLEVWRSKCSITHVRNFENETLKLYYYRSVRLLLQPYLELLEPQNRLFKECQAAAGQICQLYKVFHQKTVFGHSTPAVHTVFVAGVTLIYCMWLARNWDDERRRKLGDVSKHTRPLVSALLFSTMDDLRACSVCLYVMAERSKFAIIFRDTFDQLMNATIGNLIERCGPDSSELIYITSSKKGETTPTLISIPDHNAGTEDSSKDIDRKGMPPAMKRTFGELQVSAHAGFVENSQIDLEEQRERKRKQGMLQKTSVPKSLSHLLVKVEEEENGVDDSKTAASKASSIRSANEMQKADTRSSSEMITPPEQTTARNKYIVKKPANVTESDWEIFQQQAFLQQHQAQQNLQAYLSSLNGVFENNNSHPLPPNNGTGPQLDNRTANNISPQPPQTSLNPISENHPSLFAGVENRTSALSPGMASPASWQQGNSEVFQRRQPANFPKSPGIPLHSAPFGIVSSPRPNDNGIIFNNGTHTMINNISSWTNDSVLDLMNNNNNYTDPLNGMGSMGHHNGSVQSSATTNDQKMFVMPNRDNNPGTLNNSLNWRNSSFTNMNMSFRPQEANQGQRPQQQHPQQNSNQQQLEAMLSVPVEEFWTVNDDYGFLT